MALTTRALPFLALAAALLAAPAAWATAIRTPAPADAEAVRLLRSYLAIDTTNPPGGEMAAARFLRDALAREGVPGTIFDLGDGRANFMATLAGTGKRRPVVLLHHMDVVPADRAAWHVPPFAGVLRDGYVYGRGAVDVKGKGIVDLLALLRLKRSGIRLDRDVVLLAVADEEAASRGTKWMLARHGPLLKRAEVVIDEGASVRLAPAGRPPTYLVSIAEKTPVWLTITFRGEAGHGSRPAAEDAPSRAIAAAARILAARPAPRVHPALRDYVLYRLAEQDLRGLPGYAGDAGRALEAPAFLAAVAERWPELGAALSDTIAITRLVGGDKINTIPNQATIGLDCRLLPGTDRMAFLARLRAAVADPAAEIRFEDTGGLVGGPASPTDGPFMKALARVAAKHDPGAKVVPMVLLASTDAAFYRAAGIDAYGWEPYAIADEDYDRAHGNDERLPAAALAPAVDRLVDLLRELDR